MDIFITFVPLLFNGLIIIGIIYFLWRTFKRNSNYKDQMLQQLMAKNKELEEKVDMLLQRSEGKEEEI